MQDNVISFESQRKTTVNLFALREQGLSLKEISKRTGIPKSTIERKLKMEAPISQKRKPSQIVQLNNETNVFRPTRGTSHAVPPPPQQKESITKEVILPSNSTQTKDLQHTPEPSQIVQLDNETKVFRPMAAPSAPIQPIDSESIKSMVVEYLKENIDSKAELKTENHQATQPSQIVQHDNETKVFCPTHALPHPEERPSSKLSWSSLGRLALLISPVLALTPWLVCSSAEVYAGEVGKFWAWPLALGFELFFIALATLAPSVCLKAGTPRQLMQSIPNVAKVVCWYALLAATAFYSYHTMTLSVTKDHAVAMQNISATASNSEEIREVRQEKKLLLESIAQFESKGWLGESRKLRERLPELDAKIEAARLQANATAPSSLAAIEHKTSVNKFLRLFVLLINVICMHLVVRELRISKIF